jgi:catechol 2,3-dioxygenase-like lactoylglutathione lyase family enzyme
MERLINKLLDDFQAGMIERRDLVRYLLAAAALTANRPAAAQRSGFTATGVDHISYQASNYTRTRDFYVDLLGMKVLNDNGKQCFLSAGATALVVRNNSGGSSRIDHVAYRIENWDKDAVEAELRRRGLQPRLDPAPGQESFHVDDPDGFDVQISSGSQKRR